VLGIQSNNNAAACAVLHGNEESGSGPELQMCRGGKGSVERERGGIVDCTEWRNDEKL